MANAAPDWNTMERMVLEGKWFNVKACQDDLMCGDEFRGILKLATFLQATEFRFTNDRNLMAEMGTEFELRPWILGNRKGKLIIVDVNFRKLRFDLCPDDDDTDIIEVDFDMQVLPDNSPLKNAREAQRETAFQQAMVGVEQTLKENLKRLGVKPE